jgi:hypothetical protein
MNVEALVRRDEAMLDTVEMRHGSEIRAGSVMRVRLDLVDRSASV